MIGGAISADVTIGIRGALGDDDTAVSAVAPVSSKSVVEIGFVMPVFDDAPRENTPQDSASKQTQKVLHDGKAPFYASSSLNHQARRRCRVRRSDYARIAMQMAIAGGRRVHTLGSRTLQSFGQTRVITIAVLLRRCRERIPRARPLSPFSNNERDERRLSRIHHSRKRRSRVRSSWFATPQSQFGHIPFVFSWNRSRRAHRQLRRRARAAAGTALASDGKTGRREDAPDTSHSARISMQAAWNDANSRLFRGAYTSR
jgi:hypothetical protein